MLHEKGAEEKRADYPFMNLDVFGEGQKGRRQLEIDYFRNAVFSVFRSSLCAQSPTTYITYPKEYYKRVNILLHFKFHSTDKMFEDCLIRF